MTIEYTYPEQRPTGATVHSKESTMHWDITNEDPPVSKREIVVPLPDVPEVCEAMMTLAGHEWPPKGKCSVCLEEDRAVAERIIARLEPGDGPFNSDWEKGQAFGLRHAVRIVREECGL